MVAARAHRVHAPDPADHPILLLPAPSTPVPCACPTPTFLELYSSQRFWWKSRYSRPATAASRKLTKQ